jgi:RNA polymerase-binding transcription factor DksA
MSSLSREQIDALCRLMDERWNREVSEIRSVVERSRDDRLQESLAGRAADRLDEALTEIAQRADYVIVRQDVQDVRDIEAARSRLAAGTYGACIDCGRDIPYERLLAYPTAKRCIDCQREHEELRAVRVRRGAH